METSVTVGSQTSSNWIPCNIQQDNFKVSLGLEITGTGTYKVEHTFDNIQTDASPTAFDHSVLTAITSNTDSNYNFPVRAVRLTCTAWTSGSATLMIIQ
jgi:uncharacterized protein YgiM (DUF1202 family)